MKITPENYTALKEDIQAIVNHYKFDIKTADHGKTGCKTMWQLFHAAGLERSQDDSHPAFTRGRTRVLPCVGVWWGDRLYKQGLNDSHIETALKAIRKEMENK